MPPANQAKSILPQAVLFCKEEFAKMQATLALHADTKANQVSHSQVAFAKNPPGLFTLEAIKIAKGLKLIAMGTLAKPKGDLPKGAIATQHGGIGKPIPGNNSMIGRSSHSHRNVWFHFGGARQLKKITTWNWAPSHCRPWVWLSRFHA